MFSTAQLAAVERLPRGPHKLSREEVRAHQRERLLHACVECSAANGYADTTVGDIVKQARASRAAFYEQFADREECFLAAYDNLTRDLVRELVDVGLRHADYVTGMRDGVGLFVEWLQRWPAGSRAWSFEILALGAAGLDARERAIGRVRRLFDTIAARARSEQAGLPDLPDVVSRAVILASLELATDAIRSGQLEARRQELEASLLYLWLLGLAGHEVAASAVAHR